MVPNPEAKLLRAVLEFVEEKDAIVVAGAVAGRADYLVTFDRRHLIDLPEASQQLCLPIVLPKVALQTVRAGKGGGGSGSSSEDETKKRRLGQ